MGKASVTEFRCWRGITLHSLSVGIALSVKPNEVCLQVP